MDTSPPAVESRLSAFQRRCAGLGLALTPQRLAIYRMLAGDPTHPTAEDVFRHVKPGMPSLSLATVYRTLELFEGHGLVSRVLTDGAQARFDANLEEHHHFLCVRCRGVHDFQDPRLTQLPIADAAPEGFRVLGHRIQVLGLCPTCQREQTVPDHRR
jgi:Fur family transcriptional regulator, peroxide stress response regulator